MTNLPQSIHDLAEFPALEDVGIAVLRPALELPVRTLIPDQLDVFPFVLVRGNHTAMGWGGQERFVDRGVLAVHTFTDGPEADDDGARLSEAIRVILREAAKRKVRIDDRNHLHRVTMTSRPRRVSDWATSQGPVQYADLPTGVQRYESLYRVTVRHRGP